MGNVSSLSMNSIIMNYQAGRRPKALDPEKWKLAIRLHQEQKYTVQEICQMMQLSKPTLYKYLDERVDGLNLQK